MRWEEELCGVGGWRDHVGCGDGGTVSGRRNLWGEGMKELCGVEDGGIVGSGGMDGLCGMRG